MDINNKKIIFMGTPDFSVPTLTKLYEDKNIDLLMVVTKEDKEAGRGKDIKESDIKSKAKELNIKYNKNIPIYTPHKIKDDVKLISEIKNLNPDFIIVVAYGQILPKEILDIPKYACINGHASLLPKYRGASPIQGALLNGEKETGTTTMLMSEGMDEGDILLTKKIDIDDEDTAGILFEKLSYITADLLIETINDFNNIKPIKQDNSKATYVKMIKKEDGLIDINNDTIDMIDRKVRGYYPWPSSFIKDENGKIIKIFKIKKYDGDMIDNNKIIFKYGKDKLLMRCKDGYVEILELQAEGKKRMNSRDYINGMK